MSIYDTGWYWYRVTLVYTWLHLVSVEPFCLYISRKKLPILYGQTLGEGALATQYLTRCTEATASFTENWGGKKQEEAGRRPRTSTRSLTPRGLGLLGNPCRSWARTWSRRKLKRMRKRRRAVTLTLACLRWQTWARQTKLSPSVWPTRPDWLTTLNSFRLDLPGGREADLVLRQQQLFILLMDFSSPQEGFHRLDIRQLPLSWKIDNYVVWFILTIGDIVFDFRQTCDFSSPRGQTQQRRTDIIALERWDQVPIKGGDDD